jgi:hypothetical protein
MGFYLVSYTNMNVQVMKISYFLKFLRSIELQKKSINHVVTLHLISLTTLIKMQSILSTSSIVARTSATFCYNVNQM